jgi:hypothetical protein
MMFDHVKRVQNWTTMAYHVYNLVYRKVMTIVIYDMQLENNKAQFILWRQLNIVVLKKGLLIPILRASWQTMPKQIKMLSISFMGVVETLL